MNTAAPPPPTSHNTDRGNWAMGIVWEVGCLALVAALGFAVAVIGAQIKPDYGYAGLGVWILFGASQWLFVIPAGIWLHRRGRHDTALGLWISAGIAMLVNGACFGLMGGF